MFLDISKNKALWLSALIHFTLIALIGLSTTHIPKQSLRPNYLPIKSYLYKKTEIKPQPNLVKPEPKLNDAKPTKRKTQRNIAQQEVKTTNNHSVKKQQIERSMPETFNSPDEPKVLSALEHLEQLRQSINTAPQYRSSDNYGSSQPSIFHSNLPAVPIYKKPIDTDEERKANTQRLSSSMSITKHNNGTCSITEDLTTVGMEGIKATQYFGCGESQFDKSFREHMVKYKNGRTIN